MKMYHTPFIKFIAYQLQVNESLAMHFINADNARIESLDENIVQIVEAGENGLIRNGTTKTKGIKQGDTKLKITMDADATHRKTIIYLPIRVQNMATKGSFNVGTSAGGTTFFENMPRDFGGVLVDKDGYWTLSAKSSNGSNNEYPRCENLTPNLLSLEIMSEANKTAVYRMRIKGNGLGLITLKCADYEKNIAAGIVPALRQITRWQVACFHSRYNTTSRHYSKCPQGILAVDETHKIYLLD